MISTRNNSPSTVGHRTDPSSSDIMLTFAHIAFHQKSVSNFSSRRMSFERAPVTRIERNIFFARSINKLWMHVSNCTSSKSEQHLLSLNDFCCYPNVIIWIDFRLTNEFTCRLCSSVDTLKSFASTHAHTHAHSNAIKTIGAKLRFDKLPNHITYQTAFLHCDQYNNTSISTTMTAESMSTERWFGIELHNQID